MIYLHYKEFKIGKLDFIDGIYVYNSLDEEKLALEKYYGMLEYDLINSINKKSINIFDFFANNFLKQIENRKDILEKIDNKDKNCYEILEKLCKLNLDKFGFWLSN